MGQGDFTVEYPPLHDLAVSNQPVLQYAHDKLLELDPQPHKETFLKPFHREQTPEFCSSCHKVHLDVPGQRLSLVPRLQRLRQLAGVRRVGRGRAVVLLPAGAAALRRLPHAARGVERSGRQERSDPLASIRRRQHGAAVRESRSDAAQSGAGLPQGRTAHRRHLRSGQDHAPPPARLPAAVAGGDQRLASTFAVGEESADSAARRSRFVRPSR